MPFVGHPILGTAYVIRNKILKEPAEKVVLNLKVGLIPVTFQPNGVLWMRQKEPTFRKTFDKETIARILSIDADAIDDRFQYKRFRPVCHSS